MVSIDSGNKAFTVLYQDGSGEHEVEAPLLINATGSWIDEVNVKYGLPHNYRINTVSGIHMTKITDLLYS